MRVYTKWMRCPGQEPEMSDASPSGNANNSLLPRPTLFPHIARGRPESTQRMSEATATKSRAHASAKKSSRAEMNEDTCSG